MTNSIFSCRTLFRIGMIDFLLKGIIYLLVSAQIAFFGIIEREPRKTQKDADSVQYMVSSEIFIFGQHSFYPYFRVFQLFRG